jgi:hypothetical protein
MANTILPGYVMPLGDKYLIHFDHAGPASYVSLVTGSAGVAASGGDKINASDIGMGGFDNFDTMMDATGTYYALVVPVLGANGNAVPSVILVWYVAATDAQVAPGTNLSAFSIRCEGICV